MAFYERQQLRQQAKQDALDNYFRDLGKNITSSGMRSQDVPGLLQKNKDWQQYYQQNKSAILNPKLDNGQAYSTYMSLYQDQLGHINQSKEALKTMDEVGKLRINPQTSYVSDDPHFMEQIQKHELPIGDPNRQGINLATMALPDKPIDTKELDAYNKYLTGGISHDKIPGQTENIGNFKTRTPIYSQYSPENQKVIGEHAANAYDTDRRWRNEANKVFKNLMHDPTEYEKYNSKFKSLYGSDIDSPKEAWIAKGILDNNMKATEYKEGEDVYGRSIALDKLRTANDLWLAKEKAKIPSADVEMNNAWLEGYWRNRIQPAKQGQPTKFADPDHPLQMKIGYELKPDKVMLDALAKGGRQPDAVYVTTNNEIQPVFYEYEEIHDDKGKKIGVQVKTDQSGQPVPDKDLSKPMDLEQALISTGYKTLSKGKAFSQTMSNIVNSGESKPQAKQKSYSINGKSYTHKQLNDMGYDDKEIQQAINSGIITQ
jgi:hypothetical protein